MAVIGSNPKPAGKVITGLQDVIEKRSNSVKPKPKVISPSKVGYNQPVGSVANAINQSNMSGGTKAYSPAGKGSDSPNTSSS